MSNLQQQEKDKNPVKSFLNQPAVKKRLAELVGKRSEKFSAQLLQIAQSNDLLSQAEPSTLMFAALTATALDLDINQSLGYAYIVPYNTKVNNQWIKAAQFQLGYKGFIQLALRTNEYKNINAIPVHENQFKSFNYLTEFLDADFTVQGEGEIVGYVAYLKLISGFSKTIYWTKEQVTKHAQTFSKTFNNKNSAWKTNFDAMAIKTVIKSLISKWGPTSTELKTAIAADQSIQRQEGVYDYDDNGTSAQVVDEETERVKGFIQSAETSEDLEQVEGFIGEDDSELRDLFNQKKSELDV